MLEPPFTADTALGASLLTHYGLTVQHITFLPLGNDINTAVYRAVTTSGAPYFVKLRRGDFNAVSLTWPAWLHAHGVAPVIAPVPTRTGALYTRLDAFNLMLYPFIPGRTGYATPLSEAHWHTLGAALHFMHTASMPPALTHALPRETYSAHWRDAVTAFLARIAHEHFAEPSAHALATLLHDQRAELHALIARTTRYAHTLAARALDFVVCHADLHAGNVHIADDGAFYIVDWDTLVLAPKERDLMFIGGGQGFTGHTPEAETALFYAGYGPAPVDTLALAYYRYERIIQDIAAYCEELLLTDAGGADRPQALRYVQSNFLPDGTLALAYRADAQFEQIRE